METEGSECKTLFLVFNEVLRFSEGFSSSIDPKILFKCAKVVEDMYIKTVSIGAVKEFESKLDEFWTLQGLELFPLQYFENASRLIISRFLCDSRFSDSETKLAIEEFISYKSEEEFIQTVKELSHTQHIVNGLWKSIDTNSQHSGCKAVFFVEEMKKLLINTNGDTDSVYSAINKIANNNEEGLQLLLKVLCLNNHNKLSLHIQELVLLFVCNSLKDIKAYTYSCISNLSHREFSRIVVRWESFTDSLVNILEFSIKRLKCEYSDNSYSWTNSTGEESGLSFGEIVALINKLKTVEEKYDCLKQILHRWRNENFIIAEDLLRICKIK